MLPTITLNDIEREKPVDEMTRGNVENASVQWNFQPTNGLVYLQAVITAEVPDDLLPYIPLFCQVNIEENDMWARFLILNCFFLSLRSDN